MSAVYDHSSVSKSDRVRWCSGGDAGPSEAERSCWPKFTLHEIAKHASLNDAWIVVFDRVFDITSFAITHPGFHNAGQVSTALAITRTLGTECSDEFASLHSPKAWAQLHDFQVGVVFREGDALDTVDVAPPALPMMRKWKEKTRGHVPETLGPAPETLNPTKREDTGYTVPRRDHRPTPTWLTSDRNFWKRFGAGVDDNVLRYLTKQGYKQSRGGGEGGDGVTVGTHTKDSKDSIDGASDSGSTASSQSRTSENRRRRRLAKNHSPIWIGLAAASAVICKALLF